MIAMALACEPKLLIADEPTTALDVTVQAQVLELIHDLKKRLGMAMLLITHDLGVVAETADRVVVMYAGRKVEEGARRGHLRDAAPSLYARAAAAAALGARGRAACAEIPGTVPSPFDCRTGCSFAPRCAWALARCRPRSRDLAGRRARASARLLPARRGPPMTAPAARGP